MERKHYTSQFKTKIVLELLQGERELGEIAAENNLNPNMVRNWKREFLASIVFEDPRKAERKAKREEEGPVKKVPLEQRAMVSLRTTIALCSKCGKLSNFVYEKQTSAKKHTEVVENILFSFRQAAERRSFIFLLWYL